jgi:hypothetical protein
MTTVADIADAAFDAVADDITDAVHAATVTTTAQGAYNAATGAYSETDSEETGRAVFANERPVRDIFPDYQVGPGDQLLLVEGVTSLAEGNAVTINSVEYVVRAVQDIAGAGALFYAVAREV